MIGSHDRARCGGRTDQVIAVPPWEWTAWLPTWSLAASIARRSRRPRGATAERSFTQEGGELDPGDQVGSEPRRQGHVGFRVAELAASLFYLSVPLLAVARAEPSSVRGPWVRVPSSCHRLWWTSDAPLVAPPRDGFGGSRDIGLLLIKAPRSLDLRPAARPG
jgi:hypothetical protein